MKKRSGSNDPQTQKDNIIEVEATEVIAPKSRKVMIPGVQQINIGAIMSQAVMAGNVEMAEKMLDLYERMEKKQAKKQFDQAMAKFQAECPVIKKTKVVSDKGGKERYRFAPIDSIVDQTGPYIAKNGLSYTVNTHQDGKMFSVIVTKRHIAGYSEDTEFSIPIGSEEYMSEPQKYGARCTFAKRYAFCNAFGILTGDGDTDAVEENKQVRQEETRPKPRAAEPKKQEPKNNSFVIKVKKRLHDLGAVTEYEALELLHEITGLKWNNLKNVTERMAENALQIMDKKEEKEKAPVKIPEPKEGDICNVDGKIGTLVKDKDGKLVCLVEDAIDNDIIEKEKEDFDKKQEEAIAAKANEPLPLGNPKERYPVGKSKADVIRGLLLSKRGYKTEEIMVRYINTASQVGSPEFPKRQIDNIEDLNMDEADKIIKILMTIKSEK